MINIISKELCVGCNACAQRCPQSCIVMEEDHEGFLYPKIDLAVCVDCGICEKVCPVIHQAELSKEEPATYACYNKDEDIRKQSSSGGIFTLLAESILAKNGVVFGARFDDNFDVIHDYTETVDGLKAFRGSKYVQSKIGETYKQAEYFLKDGREVLFSGTPCQIAGLKRFLRKEYSNLLSVDFICHGVPSPKVWRMYKESLLDKVEKSSVSATAKPEFTDIQFRDKTDGWKKYSFAATIRIADQNTVLLREPLNKNIFLRGFLKDLYLRPSCHCCPSKSFKSGSDITIADYWGVYRNHKGIDDDMGISLLLIQQGVKKGFICELLNKSSVLVLSDFAKATKYNPAWEKSCTKPVDRTLFYQRVNETNLDQIVIGMTELTFSQRFKQNVRVVLRKIIYR